MRPVKWFITYLFYPLSVFLIFSINPDSPWQFWCLAVGLPFIAIGMAAMCGVFEWLFPGNPEWSFGRTDLVRAGIFILFQIVFVNWIFKLTYQTLYLNPRPFTLQLTSPLLAILTADFVQYWVHRWSHSAKGPIGRFLWRIHSTHHLNEKMTVFIFSVVHPLSPILFSFCVALPLYFMGFPIRTIVWVNAISFLFNVLTHSNLNIRLGWLNRVVAGPETHVFHHSADPAEACNYGVIFTLFDQVFGSYSYHPGRFPKQVGVNSPDQFPQLSQIGRILLFPFRPF